MAYATHTDLVERYGTDAVVRAFDKDGDGAVDSAVESKALEDASDIIDTYVGAKYDLPLTTVPDILVRVCCELAMYLGSADAATQTEENKERHAHNLDWLKMVAKGTVSLGLDVPPESIPLTVQTSYPNTRLFTRTTLKGLL